MLKDTDNSVVLARGKGVGVGRSVQNGGSGMEIDCGVVGAQCCVQIVLLSCTLETWMVL